MTTDERTALLRRGVIVLGISVALLVWLFGARLFRVDGASMYPTFNIASAETKERSLFLGDYLVIDLFSYLFLEQPQRFDVVVFKSPLEPQRYLLKRIIALPGEQVFLEKSSIRIKKVDGDTMTLAEKYVHPDHRATYRQSTVVLKEKEYFLLGDNRTNSLDSRVWGALPRENILGRVIMRLYPVSEFALHPGAYSE